MSIHRRISFSQSMHDWKASARPAVAPLFAAGRFNVQAIMNRAIKLGRSLRAGGKSWAWRMSVALRTAWGQAKREAALPTRQAA